LFFPDFLFIADEDSEGDALVFEVGVLNPSLFSTSSKFIDSLAMTGEIELQDVSTFSSEFFPFVCIDCFNFLEVVDDKELETEGVPVFFPLGLLRLLNAPVGAIIDFNV